MATLAITIFLTILALFLLKIIWIWIRQTWKILSSNVPSPGFTIPLLGHSYLALNVSPGDISDLIVHWIKTDKKCRKVSIFGNVFSVIFDHNKTINKL